MATSLNPGECPPRLPFYQLWLHGYLTYPWRMPTMPVLLRAVATWFLTNPWSRHTTPSQVWLCGFSPIPWVRPPHPPLCLCQLWLRGYLTNPWSTHTTPSQVWLCGYLLHPWSMPPTPISLPLPGVSTWLLTNPWSMHTTPSQVCLSHVSLEYAHHAHPLPAVAMWLSHLSLDHAHHARPSTSCGYVASHQSLEYAHNAQSGVPISPIPGVRPPRPPSAFCGYLTYPCIMPTTPALLPAATTWLLTSPWSMHTTPSQVCLSHLSLDHAHHARPSTSCGYVALPPIPGIRPTHPANCQVWLCGYLPYPSSTPTLCQRRLHSYLSYPWSTPILWPDAARRLLTCPWNTPTTPTQPQVWWLRGHLTFHQLGFSG